MLLPELVSPFCVISCFVTMTARTGGQADYLYPNKDIPAPLPEDFYKEWLAGGSPAAQVRSSARSQSGPSATEALVEQLIKENQDLIEKEALKQAAAASVNVHNPQYSNLIPLSFDYDDFIKKEEERRNKAREMTLKQLHLDK
ncbi:unnamed protein product [Cylicocyclus nassatus]|uniref:Uncharacterized protein n=1 Tax=Cylicocyclus nassatus TaxID=53992 RepID=A0AA36MFM6_CYLNA|nr:unnamed protein product [Cylicocyclus nassatus]